VSRDPVPLYAPRSPEPEAERSGSSDRELVEAILQGDARVAAELHDRLVTVIDQTLVRILGRRENDHDDLMQSAFEQVLRSLLQGGFLGACSLRTWANRVTTHVGLNAIRSRQRERRVIDRDSSVSGESGAAVSESRAESEVETRRLRRHLAAMNLAQAEMLILHDLYGHSLTEIAGLLGVTQAAAQSRLVRGRHELRQRLEKDASGQRKGGQS